MKRRNAESREQLRLRQTLRWRLTFFVVAIMVASGFLTAMFYALVLLLFAKTPIVLALTVNPLFLGIVLMGVRALIGTLMSVFLGKLHLRPVKLLSQATKEVK